MSDFDRPDDMPIVAPIRMGSSTGFMQRLSKGLSRSSRQLSEQVVGATMGMSSSRRSEGGSLMARF